MAVGAMILHTWRRSVRHALLVAAVCVALASVSVNADVAPADHPRGHHWLHGV